MFSVKHLLNQTCRGFGQCRPIITCNYVKTAIPIAQMSSAAHDSNDVTIEEVIRYIHKGGAMLIDVRNLNEVQELGRIPTAQNVPLPELNQAMALGGDAFRAKYGFDKPQKSNLLITYCMRGRRAEDARDILQRLGYSSTKRYPGSWLEWIDKQPEVKKALEGKTK